MPAVSDKQRKLMAIAEHHPSEVSAKNRGVLKMSHSQLHDFAATKGLHKEKTLGHGPTGIGHNRNITGTGGICNG
jgi:hypothetical protein